MTGRYFLWVAKQERVGRLFYTWVARDVIFFLLSGGQNLLLYFVSPYVRAKAKLEARARSSVPSGFARARELGRNAKSAGLAHLALASLADKVKRSIGGIHSTRAAFHSSQIQWPRRGQVLWAWREPSIVGEVSAVNDNDDVGCSTYQIYCCENARATCRAPLLVVAARASTLCRHDLPKGCTLRVPRASTHLALLLKHEGALGGIGDDTAAAAANINVHMRVDWRGPPLRQGWIRRCRRSV